MRRKLSASEIKKRLRAGAYHDGAKPLSAKRVQRLKGEGRYHDADVRGLYLQVSASGARSWLLRYELLDKERMMGLGSAQEFSLAQARDRAREARRQLADGNDPLVAKRTAKAASKLAAARRLTFREAAQQYYRQHMPEWRSVIHAKQWQRSLEVYAFPAIGDIDVGDITTADILRVIESAWLEKAVTLDRVRNRIESIIDWAVVRGHRQAGTNPARWRGHLSEVLASVKKIAKPQHHAALAYAEVSVFMQELRRQKGIAARALEFTILTAARAGETLGAKWDEIDFDNKTWVIPATRMKAGREHHVPLAPLAIELLRNVPREDGNAHVFIGAKAGAGLSAIVFFRLLARMGRDDITTHGFRSAFSDWAHESTAHANHAIELALAHSIGTEAEKAYRRGNMLAKRVKLAADWAKFCTSKPVAKADNVVPMHGGRAR
jgi:integrase